MTVMVVTTCDLCHRTNHVRFDVGAGLRLPAKWQRRTTVVDTTVVRTIELCPECVPEYDQAVRDGRKEVPK